MTDEIVLDASVAADHFFPRPGSLAAWALFQSDLRVIAPDLIFAEFASVATRLVRQGQASDALAREAIKQLRLLVDEVAPLCDLAGPAYDLARRYSFSACDAVYLALARRRDIPLVTADAKLARKAVEVGLAGHVRLLIPES